MAAQITQKELETYLAGFDGLHANSRADFTNYPGGAVSDFTGLDFSFLSCFSADFVNPSMFTNCRFISTTLSNASLGGTTQTPSDFLGTTLQYINGTSPMPEVRTTLNYCNFENASITDCDFSNDSFTGSSFKNTKIVRNNFVHAIFGGSVFLPLNTVRDCNFTHANFNAAEFDGTTFENCDFSGVRFINCNYKNVEFKNCKLVGAEFDWGTPTNLYVVVFENCDVEQSRIPTHASVQTFFVNTPINKVLQF